MNDLHNNPKQTTPLFSPDDVRDLLALLPEDRRDADPEDLEALLAESGRLLNEAHPMPVIQAPDKDFIAAHASRHASPVVAPIPFMRRRVINNGLALLAMAASFALGLILFPAPPVSGPVGSVTEIETDHKTRSAPPHPEALSEYNVDAADALLKRANHLMALWHFHQDPWYPREALRNLLEAWRYRSDDARVADALADVYKELHQPTKAEKYRMLAEALRVR